MKLVVINLRLDSLITHFKPGDFWRDWSEFRVNLVLLKRHFIRIFDEYKKKRTAERKDQRRCSDRRRGAPYRGWSMDTHLCCDFYGFPPTDKWVVEWVVGRDPQQTTLPTTNHKRPIYSLNQPHSIINISIRIPCQINFITTISDISINRLN